MGLLLWLWLWCCCCWTKKQTESPQTCTGLLRLHHCAWRELFQVNPKIWRTLMHVLCDQVRSKISVFERSSESCVRIAPNRKWNVALSYRHLRNEDRNDPRISNTNIPSFFYIRRIPESTFSPLVLWQVSLDTFYWVRKKGTTTE